MTRIGISAALLALVAATTAALAQTPPAPFAKGDAKSGKALVDRDCVSCHAAKFANDPDHMYTRADHRVKSPGKLLAQVQAYELALAAADLECGAGLQRAMYEVSSEYEEEFIAAHGDELARYKELSTP